MGPCQSIGRQMVNWLEVPSVSWPPLAGAGME